MEDESKVDHVVVVYEHERIIWGWVRTYEINISHEKLKNCV